MIELQVYKSVKYRLKTGDHIQFKGFVIDGRHSDYIILNDVVVRLVDAFNTLKVNEELLSEIEMKIDGFYGFLDANLESIGPEEKVI